MPSCTYPYITYALPPPATVTEDGVPSLSRAILSITAPLPQLSSLFRNQALSIDTTKTTPSSLTAIPSAKVKSSGKLTVLAVPSTASTLNIFPVFDWTTRRVAVDVDLPDDVSAGVGDVSLAGGVDGDVVGDGGLVGGSGERGEKEEAKGGAAEVEGCEVREGGVDGG
ncbi:hypothetical protein Cgig2_026955 [Carnegiea gigantea]|uniref:Uncharacterized protein n=1 Tax=Carnegiea gigantea TaxID=171969 RepID=A0A9Q1KYK3_9CARY|nr:hypothetical protein Cgig2_026955 [Carnegiea gigantea]